MLSDLPIGARWGNTNGHFLLGTHEVHWLADPAFTSTAVPLFVSHRRLSRRRTLPTAGTNWSVDSGGFSELQLFGGWRTTPTEYISAVHRYAQMGRLQWAAPMDWMCEPVMLARTGLSVEEHQRRTVENFVLLRHRAPDLPFIPVLQGWRIADYERCGRMYADAGIDLAAEPLVGLGSVCRRQATTEIADLVGCFADQRLRLHAFGSKTRGLALYGHLLHSADSLSWSYAARRSPPLAGHTHKNCANCPDWALRWRQRLLADDPFVNRERTPLLSLIHI